MITRFYNFQEYSEAFLTSIQHPENFSLENRKKAKGGGYYFPIPPQEREEWNSQMSKIVANARELVEQTGLSHLPPKIRYSAFRELVHLGITNYYQRRVARKIASKFPFDFELLNSEICRSGIDRGGKQNAEKLYGNPSEKEEIAQNLVTGVAFARALLSRRRLIIHENLEQLANLATIPKEELQKFLKETTVDQISTQGISLTYSPGSLAT